MEDMITTLLEFSAICLSIPSRMQHGRPSISKDRLQEKDTLKVQYYTKMLFSCLEE
jgi:hypothetical protein